MMWEEEAMFLRGRHAAYGYETEILVRERSTTDVNSQMLI
jgi:hypothetical protein